ncbi:MAG: hypothetical protein J0I28_07230 [Caulobacterales bacterium]|nr:hypothetical protein [Caulobacterales bacterium]
MTPLIFAAALAAVGASDLEAAFENTIQSTYPSGRSAKLWLARDGSFTARGAKGAASSGVWSIKAGELCLKQRKPFPAPVTYCSPIPADAKIGSEWAARSLKGEPLKNRIVAGR